MAVKSGPEPASESRRKRARSQRRAAQWTVASYIGSAHSGNHRQEIRTFGGKDPIEFYLDVILHGTPDSVADQIHALEADAGMTYLMAAPLSRRSFNLLTEKVLPRIVA